MSDANQDGIECAKKVWDMDVREPHARTAFPRSRSEAKHMFPGADAQHARAAFDAASDEWDRMLRAAKEARPAADVKQDHYLDGLRDARRRGER